MLSVTIARKSYVLHHISIHFQCHTCGQTICIHQYCHFLSTNTPASSCSVFLIHSCQHQEDVAGFVVPPFGHCNNSLLQECHCCPNSNIYRKVAYKLSAERELITTYDNIWCLRDLIHSVPLKHTMLSSDLQAKHFCIIVKSHWVLANQSKVRLLLFDLHHGNHTLIDKDAIYVCQSSILDCFILRQFSLHSCLHYKRLKPSHMRQ